MAIASTGLVFTCSLILIIALTTPTNAQTKITTSPNQCASKLKCHECIQTPSCAWCNDPNFGDKPRCFQPASPTPDKSQCSEEFVLNPDNVLSVFENLALSKVHGHGGGGGHLVGGIGGSYNYSESWSGHGSTGGNGGGGGGGGGRIVQVAPQRLNLKLRARQSYTIYMGYSQAQDYPVDLYYLMDLSHSMLDDKEKLYSLGDHLAYTMRNLTSNFRIGFGSFVDKVVMPYVSTYPELLEHPCDECARPYGFQHALSLSSDTQQFSQMVKHARVSGNLDASEGGFDAIMQSVVCRDQIGWREQARRLLVYSTDASFHCAGDGKLGGIVQPNDGACHLSRTGTYTESSYQDYPSIEQISLSVKKHSINVIFAVTRNTLQIYKDLAKQIEGASASELERDSSNIVSIIKRQYEKITSNVEMSHNASSAVSLKFYTSCLDESGVLVNTNKCGNLRVGDVVEFKIDLEILKCPKNRAEHFQTIKIHPIGIDESLIIDLEMLCECSCEKPGDKYYMEYSPACSNRGTYKCGICECPPGTFGPHCECTWDQDLGNTTSINSCSACTSPEGLECSGKGSCYCGRCICKKRNDPFEKIYGKCCECDNFSCERHEGKICSGPDHGTCDCGTCVCKPEWTGPNCSCLKSTDTCYKFGDDKMCSGHGICKCGKCECEKHYFGPYCEKCPTCNIKCLEFNDCVQCLRFQTGPLKDKDACAANCTRFETVAVEEAIVNEEDNEILCAVVDENECRFSYVYYIDNENKVHVRSEDRKCPHVYSVPSIVLLVVAAVVLIGLAAILMWKVFTTIHDRREFAKFERDRAQAKWDAGGNPIFKQATTTFRNPTYAVKN